MTTANNEYAFFEKGVALAIANLDFAKELLVDLNYKNVETLELIINKYDEVDDIDEWKALNIELIKFVDEIKNDENLKNNRELFVDLNEPLFINKYLEKLLDSSNENDIDEVEVEHYLKDNFTSTIKKLLDIENLKDNLDEQMEKILKVIVDDHNQKDVIEGLGIVFSYATGIQKPLEGVNLEIYSLLTEADAISSFVFFLNEEDNNGLEQE